MLGELVCVGEKRLGELMGTTTQLHILFGYQSAGPPLTVFFFPFSLPQQTPTGCPRGDPQILRNLHLHEHFQRADIKTGRRNRLKATEPEGARAPGHTPTRLSLSTLLLGEQDCFYPGEESGCPPSQPQDLCTGLMGITLTPMGRQEISQQLP